jgi:hypothetical protein
LNGNCDELGFAFTDNRHEEAGAVGATVFVRLGFGPTSRIASRDQHAWSASFG